MLRNVLDHLLSVLVQHRVMLHYQEAVVVLVQYGHELEGGECSAHIHLSDIAVQSAEDAGIIAADKEDYVSRQIDVGIDDIYQKLRWGDWERDNFGIFKKSLTGKVIMVAGAKSSKNVEDL